jgi:hypothetical protein
LRTRRAPDSLGSPHQKVCDYQQPPIDDLETTSAAPRCRSTSAGCSHHNQERSRSETKIRSTAGSARRLSPSPKLRNPTPPAPAQLANPSPPPSARGRKLRSPTRRICSTIRDWALSARIEEFKRQVESIIRYAEHGGYNEFDRARRAPRRQSPSPEARNRSPPAPTPTPEPGPVRPPSPAPASRPRTPSTA